MKIAFYGSSLLSSYWNGAATYYRGLLQQLARLGYGVHFYEPDIFDRQSNRDIEAPPWAEVTVYDAQIPAVREVIAAAAEADVIVKASGVGAFDDELLVGVMGAARQHAVRVFWDVDAPATLAEIQSAPEHPLRRLLPSLDFVFTYGGGPPVVTAYTALGAKRCIPIYNALDPGAHFRCTPDRRFACDLAFLGNRLPDRETRVREFLFTPATNLPERAFILGGSGWRQNDVPNNIRVVGHVPTADHNAFNSTPLAVLNIARDSMAATGYSPATRVFEAAGAGACLITDAWTGIELFLSPGEEILVARDGLDVAECLQALSPERARNIGEAARRRVLSTHTYARRAAQVDRILTDFSATRTAKAVA